MKTNDFDYHLPPGLIAQEPIPERDKARMLVLNKKTGNIEHSTIKQLSSFFRPGDLVVLNDTRVIPARLKGKKEETGANLEILLLRPLADDNWEALIKPGRKSPPGTTVFIGDSLKAQIVKRTHDGGRIIKFHGEKSEREALFSLGQVPLPPYIKKELADEERYQTIYSRTEGSIAAPTAGLHFTPAIFKSMKKAGINIAFITLHIGLGTFRPVTVDYIADHEMHKETYYVPKETVQLIKKTIKRGNKVVAIGTTVCRTLESIADEMAKDENALFSGSTDLFIYPGFEFKIVSALLTNFHLPRSTLLMLVSAFCHKDLILKAYKEAIDKNYRFYSFGDAMLII